MLLRILFLILGSRLAVARQHEANKYLEQANKGEVYDNLIYIILT